jgi:hypothetical protein
MMQRVPLHSTQLVFAMYRFSLALFIVTLLAAPHAFSQSPSPNAEGSRAQLPLFIEVHGGYTTFSLNGASTQFQGAVGTYRDYGVVAPVQRLYPGNSIIGADVLIAPLAWLHVGIGGRTARTQASSLYGDYAGTLDITSTTRLWTVESIVRVERPMRTRMSLVASLRGGVAIGTFRLREEVRINAASTGSPLGPNAFASGATLSASGPGVSTGGTVGLRYRMGRIALAAETGYRYARVVNPDGSGVTDNNDVIFSGELPFTLGYAGWTSTLGVGMVLGSR